MVEHDIRMSLPSYTHDLELSDMTVLKVARGWFPAHDETGMRINCFRFLNIILIDALVKKNQVYHTNTEVKMQLWSRIHAMRGNKDLWDGGRQGSEVLLSGRAYLLRPEEWSRDLKNGPDLSGSREGVFQACKGRREGGGFFVNGNGQWGMWGAVVGQTGIWQCAEPRLDQGGLVDCVRAFGTLTLVPRQAPCVYACDCRFRMMDTPLAGALLIVCSLGVRNFVCCFF